MSGYDATGGVTAMRRDQIKRRALYSVTVASWAGAGYFLYQDLYTPEVAEHRTLMIYTLTVAAVLSTASLFVWFMPTSDMIYRAGMDAGRRSAGCQAFKPILTTVNGERDTASIRVLNTHG